MSIFRSLYADISEGEKIFENDVPKMTVNYPFYKCMEVNEKILVAKPNLQTHLLLNTEKF